MVQVSNSRIYGRLTHLSHVFTVSRPFASIDQFWVHDHAPAEAGGEAEGGKADGIIAFCIEVIVCVWKRVVDGVVVCVKICEIDGVIFIIVGVKFVWGGMGMAFTNVGGILLKVEIVELVVTVVAVVVGVVVVSWVDVAGNVSIGGNEFSVVELSVDSF